MLPTVFGDILFETLGLGQGGGRSSVSKLWREQKNDVATSLRDRHAVKVRATSAMLTTVSWYFKSSCRVKQG
eukprot:1283970-Amphidinium_carterae.1